MGTEVAMGMNRARARSIRDRVEWVFFDLEIQYLSKFRNIGNETIIFSRCSNFSTDSDLKLLHARVCR